MTFLHLWPIYVGALCAAIPLAVHWLTRPRPKRMPLSTLRFVREMAEQRRAHNRLRDFIILALRVAAVLLLAWALARPLWSTRAAVVPDEEASVARVVLLDASQSMAVGQGGVEAFERARARAAELLAYQGGLRAGLIRGGATARPVFDHLSSNLAPCATSWPGSRCCRSGWTSSGRLPWPARCSARPAARRSAASW